MPRSLNLTSSKLRAEIPIYIREALGHPFDDEVEIVDITIEDDPNSITGLSIRIDYTIIFPPEEAALPITEQEVLSVSIPFS